MNIRWRDIRKLAVGVFVAGFAPPRFRHLTGWLDALTNFGQRFMNAALSSFRRSPRSCSPIECE